MDTNLLLALRGYLGWIICLTAHDQCNLICNCHRTGIVTGLNKRTRDRDLTVPLALRHFDQPISSATAPLGPHRQALSFVLAPVSSEPPLESQLRLVIMCKMH